MINIIKIQISINSRKTPKTLVYNEDKSYLNQFDYHFWQPKKLDDVKRFYLANITEKRLHLIKRVKNQDW